MNGWQTRLPRPVALPDGRRVATLADARAVLLALPERVQMRPQCQALAGLLLSVVETRHRDLFNLAMARLEAELPRLGYGNTKSETGKIFKKDQVK